MKTLIVYKSRYGSTQKYAEWLKEDLKDSELIESEGFESKDLNQYDWIVFGSSIYTGKFDILPLMIKSLDKIKSKKLYLFVVGSEPPESEASKINYEQLPKEIKESLSGFLKVSGKIDLKKMSFIHKIMLKMVGKAIDEDKMDRNTLKPIIEMISKSL
jgi:menaquinone-dependent protoporphyrinogen IX oxidase